MEKFFNISRIFFDSYVGRGLISALLLISSFFAPFSAFPTLFLYVKKEKAQALLALLIGSATCFLIAGSLMGTLYIVLVAFATIVIGELINTNKNLEKIMLQSSSIILGTYFVIMLFISAGLSISPMELIADKVTLSFDLIHQTNPDAWNQLIRNTEMTKEQIISRIATQVPSIVVISVVFFIFINLIMISRFKKELALFFKRGNLKKFKVSDYFIWPTITFGALHLFSTSTYNNSVVLTAISLLLLKSILIIYFFQGLAITYLFLQKGIKTLFFRSILFSLMIIFAYVFITFVGFFDTWFNFRKYLNTNSKGEGDNL